VARRTFFCFHYQNDIFRANVVRNHWVTQRDSNKKYNTRLFWDGSLWEEVKRNGDEAIKAAIDEGLKNTSVTVVLIGEQTYARKYVKYELERSYEDGKGLLGVYIGRIDDIHGNAGINGPNPFDYVWFPNIYRTYYWYSDKGYENFSDWVEQAAIDAGR
jgi:hypothetical protein